MERSSGILLPISSLPSPYGIGAFGKEARRFVDFLAAARQGYWQVLPLGPTGYADSPYQSFSTFAGNPYFIDLDTLIAGGLLTAGEADADWGGDQERVDYAAVYAARLPVLYHAYQRASRKPALTARLHAFSVKNADWLPDYARFMALKDRFGGQAWIAWPEAFRAGGQTTAPTPEDAGLLDRARFHCFIQMLFFEQWGALKRYANRRGVRIFGDLPIYVPYDSADVWAGPRLFALDDGLKPVAVAGVPPDYFSNDGQLWGNPLYDWARMKQDGYAWWLRRMARAAELYDAVRIDHFRAFSSYWAVPYGAKTARKGEWLPGPGMDFIRVLRRRFPRLPIIAEDLGMVDEGVKALVRESGFPSMKVMEFAFDADGENGHLPCNYGPNCVCYTGTHDNSTVRGWFESAAPDERLCAARALGLNRLEGPGWGFIRAGMESKAGLFIAQMQDYLKLGDEARTNLPGSVGRNWQWRMRPGDYEPALADRIAALVCGAGR